ncbi:protein NKG7 [Tamandua tetradactyla]|uniref:protein NKG7 n=1 Tax=Tamandua tetradactyla TaxID=48850 RepID=UPI0040546A0A
MVPWRPLALSVGSLGLGSLLVALSTDFWFEAIGPHFSIHLGLWPKAGSGQVAGYIHVTQSFCILAALWGLVSLGLLVLSCFPSLSVPHRGLLSAVTGFVAAFSMMVAMAVYTIQQWGQPLQPQTQTFFSWSFYLGWVSALLLLCAGALSLGSHCSDPRPGYETL